MMMYGSKSLFCQWFYGKYGIRIKVLESARRFATGHLCGGLKFQVVIESTVNHLLTKFRQNECAYYKISVKLGPVK